MKLQTPRTLFLKSARARALAAMALLVVPCVYSKPKLSEIAAAGDRNVLVRTVRYSPPMYDFASSAGAKFEADAGGSTFARIKEFKIVDPAFKITDALCKHLEVAFGFAPPAADRVLVTVDTPKEIVKAAKITRGFIIDVENCAWFTDTAPGRSDEYYMGYNVRMRLIDATTGQVVRTAEIKLSSASPGNYRKYSERSANGGAQIREGLDQIARDAIDKLCRKALSEKG